MYKYNLVFKGEVLDTANSRDEAERLKGMYQMDYGPEIRIVKDSEMAGEDEYDDNFEPLDEDGDEDLIYDEWQELHTVAIAPSVDITRSCVKINNLTQR